MDRRIRAATQSAHAQLVFGARKQLAPYLKELMGPWFCASFDSTKDVATKAADALSVRFEYFLLNCLSLQTTFAGQKKTDAVLFCLDSVLAHLRDCLIDKTPELLSDPRQATKEEMEAKYVNVLFASLSVLGHLMGTQSQICACNAAVELLTVELLDQHQSDLDSLLDDPKLWDKFKYPNMMVRRAAYRSLTQLLKKHSGSD